MLERMVITREGDEVILRDKEEYLVTASMNRMAVHAVGRLDLEYPSWMSPTGLFFITADGYFIIDPDEENIVSISATADLPASRRT